MTDLTANLGGHANISGRLLEIIVAVAACRRWAYAMEVRYERLGAAGFQPNAISFEALMSDLESDRSRDPLGS